MRTFSNTRGVAFLMAFQSGNFGLFYVPNFPKENLKGLLFYSDSIPLGIE
jgi:hypothetical protein